MREIVFSTAAINKFSSRENLKHLRKLFSRTTAKTECRRIVKLIEEEEEAMRKAER